MRRGGRLKAVSELAVGILVMITVVGLFVGGGAVVWLTSIALDAERVRPSAAERIVAVSSPPVQPAAPSSPDPVMEEARRPFETAAAKPTVVAFPEQRYRIPAPALSSRRRIADALAQLPEGVSPWPGEAQHRLQSQPSRPPPNPDRVAGLPGANSAAAAEPVPAGQELEARAPRPDSRTARPAQPAHPVAPRPALRAATTPMVPEAPVALAMTAPPRIPAAPVPLARPQKVVIVRSSQDAQGAANAEELAGELRSQGWVVSEIKPVKELITRGLVLFHSDAGPSQAALLKQDIDRVLNLDSQQTDIDLQPRDVSRGTLEIWLPGPSDGEEVEQRRAAPTKTAARPPEKARPAVKARPAAAKPAKAAPARRSRAKARKAVSKAAAEPAAQARQARPKVLAPAPQAARVAQEPSRNAPSLPRELLPTAPASTAAQ